MALAPPQNSALQHLVDQVQTANARGTPLHIRGGDTKAFYGESPGTAPAEVHEVLDVRGLAGISSYEPSELVVTVRAGTPLAELEATLATQGQCLPFEPPRFAQGGTVGGMVAAGLAGPARAAVGGVRDYVLGATLLNGQGELLSFGGQVMKNVAGYDVSRLLAGSLGVLGVVCEVSLKVLPLPPATRTLRFDLDEATALRRLNEWGGQPLPLNASAWWEGTLVLRLSGAQAAVEAAAQKRNHPRAPGQPLLARPARPRRRVLPGCRQGRGQRRQPVAPGPAQHGAGAEADGRTTDRVGRRPALVVHQHARGHRARSRGGLGRPRHAVWPRGRTPRRVRAAEPGAGAHPPPVESGL